MTTIGIALAVCFVFAVVMDRLAGRHPIDWDEVDDRWKDKDDLR